MRTTGEERNVVLASELPQITESIRNFNRHILQVAAEHDLPVVRLDLIIDGISRGTCRIATAQGELKPGFLGHLFSSDGIHPTDTGHAMVANAFADAINERLRTRRAFGGFSINSSKHGIIANSIEIPVECITE